MNNSQQNTNLIFIAIILASLFISGGLFFALKASESNKLQREETNEPAQQQIQEPTMNQLTKTSIDDDPILGDKSTAKVAIVEFSDYECPFCNKFREQTLGQIKEDYIDTGKAIFVYRDLPLSFHNPAAQKEAIAAECAREQGGDEAYFKYHDKIYETTLGNGKGVLFSKLPDLAGEMGLDANSLKKCLEEEKYKDEVLKDAADAAKIGINGTPGFVIGKLDMDGNVEGIIISGAQPFSVFQTAIEEQLK